MTSSTVQGGVAPVVIVQQITLPHHAVSVVAPCLCECVLSVHQGVLFLVVVPF